MVVFGLAVLALTFSVRATEVPSPSEIAVAQTSILYYDDGVTELGRLGENFRGHRDLADVVNEADHLEVVIVRNNWPSKNNKKRNWVLKRLRKEAAEEGDKDKEDLDMEEFQRDLEINPDMRREINMYRAKNASNALPPIDEDSDSEPDVDLAELLDDLTLNDLEEL